MNCIKGIKSISIRSLLNGQSSGQEYCWQWAPERGELVFRTLLKWLCRECKGAERDLCFTSDASGRWYRFQPQDKRIITVWKWNWATCTSWGSDPLSDREIIVISPPLILINLEALYKENIRSLLKDKVTCLRFHSSAWSADLIHWTTFPSSVCIITSDKWLWNKEGFLETPEILTT